MAYSEGGQFCGYSGVNFTAWSWWVNAPLFLFVYLNLVSDSFQ